MALRGDAKRVPDSREPHSRALKTMPDFLILLFSCDTQWVCIKYLAGITREPKTKTLPGILKNVMLASFFFHFVR
jgi:hypothetical protein